MNMFVPLVVFLLLPGSCVHGELNIGHGERSNFMAGVPCFAILTTDPRAVCWAGGVLEGKVVLNITSPLIVRGIRMTFYGEGRVEWTDGHRLKEKSKLVKSSRTTWKNIRTSRETEIYSKTATILYGADPESTYHHILPAGNHTMPFELPVPSDLPSSFEGSYGYVRYWLECILDVVNHMEQITKKAFTVISKYNLNTDHLADKEIKRRQKVSMSCGCGSPGYYDIRYYVARRGYVPGEKILIDIRSRNYTNSKAHLVLRFKMTTNYFAQGKTLRINKTIQEGEKVLESSETLKWNPEIPIPPLPPTGLGGSRVIDIRYYLEVEMRPKAYFTDSMHFIDEIKIGTIPLSHMTPIVPVTERLVGVSGRAQNNHLLPIGYPMPQSINPLPSHSGKKEILDWMLGDVYPGESINRVCPGESTNRVYPGESTNRVCPGESTNRLQVRNGKIKYNSSPSSSLLW